MTGRVWKGQLHDILSQSPDFAKLNPKCHMNYSIIFTEISFYLKLFYFLYQQSAITCLGQRLNIV